MQSLLTKYAKMKKNNKINNIVDEETNDKLKRI